MHHRNRGNTLVSRLYFVDDKVLFYNGSKTCIQRLCSFISGFEAQSDLYINNSKSSFIYSKNMALRKANEIYEIIGFKSQILPLKYLGIPLHKGSKRPFLFYELIKDIRDRLSTWEFKSL